MPKSSKKTDGSTVEPAPQTTKIGTLVALLRGETGADVATLAAATGWQPHSVRGAIAGQIKRKLGLTVVTARIDGRTIYRID